MIPQGTDPKGMIPGEVQEATYFVDGNSGVQTIMSKTQDGDERTQAKEKTGVAVGNRKWIPPTQRNTADGLESRQWIMEITRILDLTTNIMNPAKYNTEWDNKKYAGLFEQKHISSMLEQFEMNHHKMVKNYCTPCEPARVIIGSIKSADAHTIRYELNKRLNITPAEDRKKIEKRIKSGDLFGEGSGVMQGFPTTGNVHHKFIFSLSGFLGSGCPRAVFFRSSLPS